MLSLDSPGARRRYADAVRLLVAWLLLSGALPGIARAADAEWPQFRGPSGQGHAPDADVPVRWSEGENVLWRTELPGAGWSSPVIEGDEIWMTAAVPSEVSEEERAKRLEGNTNSQPLAVSGPLSLRAVGVRRSSGELLGDFELMVKKDPQPVHTLNSYASPTPVIENGRLYCHFGAYGTACLDTRTHRVLWRNRELRIRHENGPGSSPILWGSCLIVHCDGSDLQYIVALDKATGAIAWKTDRSGELHPNPQLKKAYATPVVVDVGGRPELLSPAANWLYGYDPATGEERWKASYGILGFSNVQPPVVRDGLAYVCTCFVRGELLAIRLPRGGDAERAPAVEWRYHGQVPKISSPLLVGDEIYFVSDRSGILSCVDARTGELVWRQRLGGNHCASPLYAGGRIYVSSREGVTAVFRPGREFELLAENRLEGSHMASAAVAGDALYLRTDKALYRIEQREAAASAASN